MNRDQRAIFDAAVRLACAACSVGCRLPFISSYIPEAIAAWDAAAAACAEPEAEMEPRQLLTPSEEVIASIDGAERCECGATRRCHEGADATGACRQKQCMQFRGTNAY